MASNHNDGFGIDELTVAQIAPIPLPASGLLALTGLAGLAMIAAGPGRKTSAL